MDIDYLELLVFYTFQLLQEYLKSKKSIMLLGQFILHFCCWAAE